MAAVNPLDATSIVAATGLIGIFCVLVAETGLLVGFFLPGDSLLFTAGLLAATQGPPQLPLGPLLAVAAAGALIGAQLGYVIGRRLGAGLLRRNDPAGDASRGGPVEGGDRPVRARRRRSCWPGSSRSCGP